MNATAQKQLPNQARKEGDQDPSLPPKAERHQHLNAKTDNVWMDYEQARKVLNEIRHIAEQPKQERPEWLIVHGDVQAGKTYIGKRFKYEEEKRRSERGESSENRVIMANMPESPGLRELYEYLLHSANVPYRKSHTWDQKKWQLINTVEYFDSRLIVIDEISNIANARPRKRKEILDSLKNLSSDLRIGVVALANYPGYRIIQSSPDLGERFLPWALPNWENGKAYLEFAAATVYAHDFSPSREFLTQKFCKRLHGKAEGTTGETVRIIRRMIKAAIEQEAPEIDPVHLDIVNPTPPSQRRSLV